VWRPTASPCGARVGGMAFRRQRVADRQIAEMAVSLLPRFRLGTVSSRRAGRWRGLQARRSAAGQRGRIWPADCKGSDDVFEANWSGGVADRQCGVGFTGGGGGFTGGGDAKAAALVSWGRPQFQLRCLTEADCGFLFGR
jgi:hypothetical protein